MAWGEDNKEHLASKFFKLTDQPKLVVFAWEKTRSGYTKWGEGGTKESTRSDEDAKFKMLTNIYSLKDGVVQLWDMTRKCAAMIYELAPTQNEVIETFKTGAGKSTAYNFRKVRVINNDETELIAKAEPYDLSLEWGGNEMPEPPAHGDDEVPF